MFVLLESGWEVREEIEGAKAELKKFFQEEAKKIMFRSKVEILEKDESCSRFFFKKVHGNVSSVSEVYDSQQNVMKSKTDILNVIGDFYSSLYSEKTSNPDLCELFFSKIPNTLEEGSKTFLGRPLSLSELGEAIKSCKKNKTPGGDGLPVELYLALWEVIGHDLLEVYNELLDNGKMPASLREGVITLIYKKKGDRLDIKNWRPITLLGVDYKLLAKVMANRLKTVIAEVIDPDQTCAIPGRKISDTLCLVRDAISYIQDRQVESVLVSLDQEKAYDRVSHAFMFKVLERLGFGEQFCKWVKLLYNDLFSSVLVNGWKTDPFLVKSGVRQGCPLSPLLFVCCIEMFAGFIRAEKGIQGIVIPGSGGTQLKCSLYMDDVSLFCRDQPSIDKLIQVCDWFGQASGARINFEKSEAMIFGLWSSGISIPFSVKTGFIKILGIWFGGEGAILKSWEERLSKVNQKFGLWQQRVLTLEGKALVLRNEILPVLLYVAQVWPLLYACIRAINKAVFHFIWGSKMDRLSRAIMFKPAKNGGKNVPDCVSILMSTFVCNVLQICLLPCYKSSKCFFFLRFYMYASLRKFGWVSLSLSLPHCWSVPFYLNTVLKFVRKNKLESLLVEDWKPRIITSKINGNEEVVPIGVFVEQTVVKIWENVSAQVLINRQKDIAWMSVHRCLPVRAFFHARGLTPINVCPRQECKREETVFHLFIECNFSKQVLFAVKDLFEKFLPKETLTSDFLLYGILQQPYDEMNKMCAWIIACCLKDVLWSARNVLIMKRKRLSVCSCKRLIMSLLRDYLLKDERKCGLDFVKKKWRSVLEL